MDDDNSGAYDTQEASHLSVEIESFLEQLGGENSTGRRKGRKGGREGERGGEGGKRERGRGERGKERGRRKRERKGKRTERGDGGRLGQCQTALCGSSHVFMNTSMKQSCWQTESWSNSQSSQSLYASDKA